MQSVNNEPNISELKRQQNAHEFIMEFTSLKALCVLLITASVLFSSTHLKIHPNKRRYISLGLLSLSMYIGLLGYIKGLNLYYSGHINKYRPDGLSIVCYMMFAGLFVCLQAYICYVLYNIV